MHTFFIILWYVF
jgi:serine/threonine protein kinase